MNYTKMKPEPWFYPAEVCKLLLLSVLCGYLFFDAWYAGLFLLPAAFVLARQDVKKHREKQLKKLEGEFRNVMVLLLGQLNAGYSLEQSIFRTTEDYGRECRRQGPMYAELVAMTRGIAMNQKAEALLTDFGRRSGIADARELADLIALSKLHGGDMIALIDRTVRGISDKQNIALELATVQAAKRFESLIMLLMPACILLYMRLTNAEYIRPLYTLPAGRIVMAAALLMTMLSGIWMDFILKKGK